MSRKIKLEDAAQPVAKSEVLQVADLVAKEKGIDREDILDAMEQAVVKTAQIKYGDGVKLEAHIDRKTGEIAVFRCMRIVDVVSNFGTEISLKDALRYISDAQIGGVYNEKLPPVDFGRVAAQVARTVIVQKVQLAERNKQYADFSSKVGEIITGTVKRIEYSCIVLDIGRTEGILKRADIIPHENFKIGERIKVYLAGLNQAQDQPLLILSRTRPEFMRMLFEQEVPEVYDGVVQIKAIARDPGSKAKIAVTTNDPNLDPVGACVGIKGARVQAVVDELRGEKIDVVTWSENPAIFIVNSLAPAEVIRVVMEETGDKVTAVVPDKQLSVAIGRRGQNVRLASKLTGWNINVTTETQENEARTAENARILRYFEHGLDIDELLAQLLISEGYYTMEDISNTPEEKLASIRGFDPDIAHELHQRASAYITSKKNEIAKLCDEKGVADDLRNYELLRPELLEVLVKSGLRTLEDLGNLSTDELLEITGDLLSQPEAEILIMKIRETW